MIALAVAIGAWVAWALIVGVIAPRLPARWFAGSGCSVTATEAHIDEVLGVRAWKRLLPDAGGWFKKGARKDGYIRTNQAALQRFVIENRRAEWVHGIVLAAAPVFFITSPLWVAVSVVVVGVLVNVPCLIALRYNRRRVTLVLRRDADRRALYNQDR